MLGERKEFDIYSDLIVELFNDEPVVETSTSEKELEVFFQKTGSKRVKIEEGVESTFIANGFPYLALAHFFCTDFRVEGPDSDINRLSLIGELANREYIIRKTDNSFFHEGLPTITLGKVGEFVPSNIGIVEPITQALWVTLINLPEDFKDFFQKSLAEKKYQLLHRMYTASRYTEDFDSTVPQLADTRNYIDTAYRALVPSLFRAALGKPEVRTVKNSPKSKAGSNKQAKKKRRTKR